MPSSCSALGCTNRAKSGGLVQFFTFPLKNEELLKLWILAVRRSNFTPTKYSRLCSAHFKTEDYLVRPGTSVRRLKPDAVPSVFAGFPEPESVQSDSTAINNVSMIKDSRPSMIEYSGPCKIECSGPSLIEYSGPSKIEYSGPFKIECPRPSMIEDSGPSMIEDSELSIAEFKCPEIKLEDTALSFQIDKEVQTEESAAVVKNLKRKIKTLQQKVRRQDNCIKTLKGILKVQGIKIRNVPNRDFDEPLNIEASTEIVLNHRIFGNKYGTDKIKPISENFP